VGHEGRKTLGFSSTFEDEINVFSTTSDINCPKSGLLYLTSQPNCKMGGRSAKVKAGNIN
jgi:hypothetical protein